MVEIIWPMFRSMSSIPDSSTCARKIAGAVPATEYELRQLEGFLENVLLLTEKIDRPLEIIKLGEQVLYLPDKSELRDLEIFRNLKGPDRGDVGL